MVSDSGLQSVEPSTRTVYQAQERLGRYPASGQQVRAAQEPVRAVEVDKRKGNDDCLFMYSLFM